MYNKKDWSNEPRQEKAVGQALFAVLIIFAFFATVTWAAQQIGSLF